MTQQTMVEVLSEIDLFSDLPARQLRSLADTAVEQVFLPGATVLVEGERVDGGKPFSPKGVGLYVIVDGVARAEVGGQHVATLTAGDYFGELSLIDGEPRSADVIAEQEGLRTLVIDKWTFESLVEKHPTIAVSVMRALCSRLRAIERSRVAVPSE